MWYLHVTCVCPPGESLPGHCNARGDISACTQVLCMCGNTHLGLAEPEDLKGQGKLTMFRAPGAEGRVPHGSCNLYRKKGGG